jgi:hypothetical protein
MCYKRRAGQYGRRAPHDTYHQSGEGTLKPHVCTVKFTPLLVWDYEAVLICPPGGQLPSSGSTTRSHSLLLVPKTNKHGSKHYHYVEHVLGVTPLPPDLWEDTCEWDRLRSVLVGPAPPTTTRPKPCSIDGSSDFSPPHNDRFECRVPVNDERYGLLWVRLCIRKWRILSHIRSHLQYRPFAV